MTDTAKIEIDLDDYRAAHTEWIRTLDVVKALAEMFSIQNDAPLELGAAARSGIAHMLESLYRESWSALGKLPICEVRRGE